MSGMRPERGRATTPGTLRLETPVQFIKGIGPRRSELLASFDIRTVADLLGWAPFRYEDRTRFRPLSTLHDGEWALARAEVCSIGGFDSRKRRLSILELLVRDRSGSVRLKFFNQPYLRQVYRPGLKLVIYGQVKQDSHAHGTLCFMNPECEILDEADSGTSVHSGRIVPIYRKLGDLRTRALRQILHRAVVNLSQEVPDPLPAYLLKQLRLLPRGRALALVHFPELDSQDPETRAEEMVRLNEGLSPAHKRLIFEELFQLQVGIAMVRENRVRQRKQRAIRLGESVREAIKKILPFHPTEAQKRVLREIADDMCSPHPMCRLLQGDVGSGKTIVAAEAAVIAVENGFQVAVMAPTEILAEQHYFSFRRLFEPLGYRTDLLTGRQAAKQKREALDRLRSGETRVAIGTHALIQQGVEFDNLALAIVDEQHRFGVVQRNTLKEKGRQPDILVMTATPIPRSLALTLYGDLEVSVIDQMPPGRMPIETFWYEEKGRQRAYDEVRSAVSARHQVYVVYPLVEESEKSDLRAATEMADHLRTSVFEDLRVGLLHGRMKSGEKESVMNAFAAGDTDILVSTTVIEVGVDVANATLMIIEHAERFGLAQLHQLRGRVGRGAAKSRCILIGDAGSSAEARKRLEIMCETNDGFRIAEVDLQLRGPGEFIGTRQSGLPAFKYADLVRDRKALEVARREAGRFLETLRSHPDDECRRVALSIRQLWTDRFGLALAG
jgi:ATP-dependent DNA helicase RecG